MQQLFFADKRLIMGGPFLDNQGGLGILDVANEAQALEILAHDPAVLAQFLEAHVHPWYVAFNQYPAQSSQSGAWCGRGQRGENQAVGHGTDDREAKQVKLDRKEA